LLHLADPATFQGWRPGEQPWSDTSLLKRCQVADAITLPLVG
jgi:hypothetical protein